MDIVDASDLERENTVADLIVKTTGGLKNGGLVPTGTCYNPNCEEEIPRPKLFCNGDCAKEHDAHQRKFKR